jgi:hypothetical protein
MKVMVLQVCKTVILMVLEKRKKQYRQFNEKYDLKIPWRISLQIQILSKGH